MLRGQQNGNTDTMVADDEHSELPNETRKCNSVPFVPSSYFLSHEVAENLATIIKEVSVQYTEDISGNEHKYINGDGPPAPWEPSLCKFFVKGLCNRGNQCSFSHSLQAKRFVCKFFLSLKTGLNEHKILKGTRSELATPHVCQVHRCNKDLSSSKSYHKSHKVCDVQSKTARVFVNSVAAECVRKILKDKTILLVTHQVDFLHNIDLILVMRDGVIVQSVKYNDILQSGVDFQALVSAHETSMELVSELLGISSELLSLKYCSGPSPVVADADIKPEVHRLIHDLVLHIHKNEPDIEKSILVFLPTYYALEQQWFLLRRDLERKIEKVILATNIAESSVTIPKVAFVIDSCRSLQVLWDSNRKTESAELVWVSKSQANQRKGRTDRTCDVLLICCAESKAINDLKDKAMDPPDPEVVEDALSLLDHINALEKTSHRGRYEPTFYGRLLVSFSLPSDASMIILKFGDMGMLREGILLGVLMDAQPLPILRMQSTLNCYYSGDDKSTALTGRKEMVFLANLCAFQFWQRVYKDKLRLDRLKQLVHFDEMKAAQVLVPEEEWCSFHNLVQPSLNHVAEIYEDILNSVHRFRPKFLGTADGLPLYYEPYEFQHTCLLTCQQNGNTDSMAADDEHFELPNETRKCNSVPFVPSSYFLSHEVAENLATIIKEFDIQKTNLATNINTLMVMVLLPHENLLYVNFLAKGCATGATNAHFLIHFKQKDLSASTSFLSRNGDKCEFSHDVGPSTSSSSRSSLCLPEDEIVYATSLLRLFPTSYDGCILLLDDTDFHFSSHLSRHYDPSKILMHPSLVSEFFGAFLTPPRQLSPKQRTTQSHGVKSSVSYDFPNSIATVKTWKNRSLLQTFFKYLAIRILADELHEVQVILTMNNIRFLDYRVQILIWRWLVRRHCKRPIIDAGVRNTT
ncbi:unnamed protein product [Camellia sinensis]